MATKMVHELELFSFDFSLFSASTQLLSCPNCGFQIVKSTPLISTSFSKSALALGFSGAFLYMSYFKPDQFRSILSDLGSTVQYFGSSVLALLKGSPADASPPGDSTTTVFNVQNQSTNITTNQWLNYSGPLPDDSIDLSSLTFSTLNSIGSSTVDKFDYLIDQVQQIKECISKEYCELHGFHSSNCSLNSERRLSESEITMPSLEWDLGDTPLEQENLCDDGYHHFGDKKHAFLYNVKYNGIIDGEVLSQIIFNKDFDFKDRIYDRMNVKKHFASLRHQLQRSSNIRRQCSSNLGSATYRSNRDSAFFEE